MQAFTEKEDRIPIVWGAGPAGRIVHGTGRSWTEPWERAADYYGHSSPCVASHCPRFPPGPFHFQPYQKVLSSWFLFCSLVVLVLWVQLKRHILMVITFMVTLGVFTVFPTVAQSIWLLPPDAFSDILIDGIHHYEHFVGIRIISEMRLYSLLASGLYFKEGAWQAFKWKTILHHIWWLMPVISSRKRLRQEDFCRFKICLSYIESFRPAWAIACLQATTAIAITNHNSTLFLER